MKTIQENTIFTNVAETSDGGVYWEGIDEALPPHVTVTSWRNKRWTAEDGEPCAHPNSRFCTPARQCPIMDPNWESPDGVPIEAIIFGGRRPRGMEVCSVEEPSEASDGQWHRTEPQLRVLRCP